MLARNTSETTRRISPRWLLAAAAIVVVGFTAICGSVLMSMRRGDEKLAHQTLGNLASSIDADVARNVELYDLSLRNVVSNMTSPELVEISRPMRQLILFDHAATARHFGAIQVMDVAGNVTLDSSTLDPKQQNFADDEFFKVHKRDPLFGLYISKPMLHQGHYGIVLSRRIAARDGTFIGVVSGFIRYSYFHEMVDRLQLEPADIITVLRQDGVIVMRAPFDMDVIGRDVSKMRGVQKALAYFSGSYVGRASNDDIERLFVWREGAHPLIVMVGRSTDVIFGQWRKDALQIGGAMGALGLIACALMLILAREMGKRGKMEDRMARLAMTDGLTGLANRRHFDVVLEKEWQRAQRTRAPISLLMIDADHFKTFNDSFGHQAGDLVLCGIAWSIARHAKRASDCAARYGGEEFALILPGLSLADAIELGERIRIEVGHLERDGMTTTTISVGAACFVPSSLTTSNDLISDADGALYAAKAHGRNQTWPVAPRQKSLAA
ncbi:sensor domain-containing diguanylate cyclase [Tardiphaga robiniae]|uniref:diguanylate cyclase n=1 Tax=Tardiphaga robiniae TaxID=943830 RepID=A0A164AUP3_9BRAD|nr:sensor domain-containing diguanylate cyclase [Tardiphaga robiniae]KZD25336.1 diguanylate cyclase [Tardiphaga robiniae]